MFEKVQKNFGFGCMRLPMKDGEVDHEAFCEMVDLFLERGFNYFDTAHGYLDGKSETALRRCLTSRYPREAYVLTNKLSSPHFKKQEDIRPLFQSQLEACARMVASAAPATPMLKRNISRGSSRMFSAAPLAMPAMP